MSAFWHARAWPAGRAPPAARTDVRPAQREFLGGELNPARTSLVSQGTREPDGPSVTGGTSPIELSSRLPHAPPWR